MSLDDTSSLSDTDSVYQDLGPMSPPLSPKHVQVTQVDVHMLPSHVHSQSPHVHTQDMSTQYIRTKSVSCDTHDIDTHLCLGEDYSMQSFVRPSSQTDRGYFSSTPYVKERMKTVEVSRNSRINSNPRIQNTKFTGPSFAGNTVIDTVHGVNPSYTLSAVTPPQMVGTMDNIERNIIPEPIPTSTIGIFVPQTPLTNSDKTIAQQMVYTPSAAGITYIPETPVENMNYGNFDRLSSQVTNTKVIGSENRFSNVPNQSSSISMRPRGLSVTFDPNLSYQSVTTDNQNTMYWSMNSEDSNRTTNVTSPHVLPTESVLYPGTNVRLPGDQLACSYPNQPRPTPRSDGQHLNFDPRKSAQVRGDQSGYSYQNPPVPTLSSEVQNLNTCLSSTVQVPGNQLRT